ncbi:hypothetical protein [Micromonospora sp. KC213]|uniref:hypothetical protein n=1 Tax=Micromonospora sp. KC213 TaxID=2530378 RepID=UPI00104FA39D|nr:hypothetical protein [Micromonospora sp. KC213]TDC41437.1 hypothetical protein E1166_11630 [Micromonospora sp. KC213]
MPGDGLPVEVGRSVLDGFRPRGAGRGRLSTASDIDFVAVTDRRLEPESRDMAALAEAESLIAESLWLRTDGAEGRRSYRSPLARRRDTLAFLDTALQAALALPVQEPQGSHPPDHPRTRGERPSGGTA